MSKAEKVAFIVKFVESEGSKKDCAAKAYEVSSTAWSSLSSSVYCLFVLQIGNHVCLRFIQTILELQSEKYLKTITEDDVLRMDKKDKSLFVFTSFTSPAFLHCKKVELYTFKQWNVTPEALSEIDSCFVFFISCAAWLQNSESTGGVVLPAATALCPQSREACL